MSSPLSQSGKHDRHASIFAIKKQDETLEHLKHNVFASEISKP